MIKDGFDASSVLCARNSKLRIVVSDKWINEMLHTRGNGFDALHFFLMSYA